MGVIDNARAARADLRRDHYAEPSMRYRVISALDDLIAEHERLTAEMQQRELHHFETEALLVQAGLDPDGKPELEYRAGEQATDAHREALAETEAYAYAHEDVEAREDFITGWRTADRLRPIHTDRSAQ